MAKYMLIDTFEGEISVSYFDNLDDAKDKLREAFDDVYGVECEEICEDGMRAWSKSRVGVSGWLIEQIA
mgnify:CR=1 FL=1